MRNLKNCILPTDTSEVRVLLKDSGTVVRRVFIGRTLGLAMVAAAIVMASGDAVMALGTSNYLSLATADVWALLWGQSPGFLEGKTTGDIWRFLAGLFLAMPAWAVIGPVGIIMMLICRKRPAPGRLFMRNLS